MVLIFQIKSSHYLQHDERDFSLNISVSLIAKVHFWAFWFNTCIQFPAKLLPILTILSSWFFPVVRGEWRIEHHFLQNHLLTIHDHLASSFDTTWCLQMKQRHYITKNLLGETVAEQNLNLLGWLADNQVELSADDVMVNVSQVSIPFIYRSTRLLHTSTRLAHFRSIFEDMWGIVQRYSTYIHDNI